MILSTMKTQALENPKTPMLMDSECVVKDAPPQQPETTGGVDFVVKNLEDSGRLEERVGSQSMQENNSKVNGVTGTQLPRKAAHVPSEQSSAPSTAHWIVTSNSQREDKRTTTPRSTKETDFKAKEELRKLTSIKQFTASIESLSTLEDQLHATTAAKSNVHQDRKPPKQDVRRFGTLLYAIDVMQNQESNAAAAAAVANNNKRKALSPPPDAPARSLRRLPVKKVPFGDAIVSQYKPKPHPPKPAVTKPKPRVRIKDKRQPDREMAQKAAALALRISQDAELSKQLLLSMALHRNSPRTPPASLPGRGHVLTARFFWAHYPPLESVLKEAMPMYYHLSISSCQSVEQQDFNNKLVQKILRAAYDRGWVFDPKAFGNAKVLRDRIRCYYKTHIQNAKKRLTNMVKNPTKRANTLHLTEHYGIIEKALLYKKHHKVGEATFAVEGTAS